MSPHFITKPSTSVTVKEKRNVTLLCKAAGFPPPIITWYKDGQVMAEDKRQFKKRKLEIKEIQFEDRGIYTCTAENLLGRVQLSVNVTVKGKLLINSTEHYIKKPTDPRAELSFYYNANLFYRFISDVVTLDFESRILGTRCP